MSIIDQDIYKLSELSKLYIDDDRIELLINQINNTLSLVDKLNNVDTTNVQPMFYPDENAKQKLRADLVTESDLRDVLQSVANKERIESGLYLVPQVITDETV